MPLPAGSAPQPLEDPFVLPTPPQRAVPPGYSHERLHLKFREGTGIRLEGEDFVSDVGIELSGLNETLASFQPVSIERLFSAPRHVLADETSDIEADSGRELADLRLYFRVDIQSTSDMEPLLQALNASSIVEIAYPEPLPAPVPVTPDFVGLQRYRAPAPDGIDADFAAGVPGGLGERVKVIDIEYAWNLMHEDLSKAGLPGALIPNKTPVDPFVGTDHGTAVLGELVADDNGFGVTGLVPNASLGMVNAFNAEDGYDLQDSIFIAHQDLGPGDVMLIEQQAFGLGGYVPVEWVPAYYDAIATATAAGVIVVEAAGNGSQDLDDPVYGSPFPAGLPDSGAIIVGAGAASNCGSPARSRLGFSTFGSRVDLQGWGQCVATTGYGGLHGLPQANDAYTASFSGTSSASPIVAAAAASVSSALEEAKGVPSTPQDVRARLIASGTPQDLTSPGALPGEIGPQPDVRAAIVTRPVSADLSITKSDSPDPATVGRALTYSLAVSNAGPDGASDVTVTDTLPVSVTFVSATPSQGTCSQTSGTVTCNLGSIASGASATVTIEVTPNQEGTITDTVGVSSTTIDPDTANNRDSQDTTVVAAPERQADLTLTKSDRSDPVTVNRRLRYTLRIRNNGPDAATGLTVTDQLPAGVTFVSASLGPRTCTEAGGLVTCDLRALASRARAIVTIFVTPTTVGAITNTAEVTANESDPNTASNSDTEQTTVLGPSRELAQAIGAALR